MSEQRPEDPVPSYVYRGKVGETSIEHVSPRKHIRDDDTGRLRWETPEEHEARARAEYVVQVQGAKKEQGL